MKAVMWGLTAGAIVSFMPAGIKFFLLAGVAVCALVYVVVLVSQWLTTAEVTGIRPVRNVHPNKM